MYYPQITIEIFWAMEHLYIYLITTSSLIAYHLLSNRNLAVNIAFRLTFSRTSHSVRRQVGSVYLSERPCLNAVNIWPLVDVDYACCIDNFFAETGSHELFIYISIACYKMIQQRWTKARKKKTFCRFSSYTFHTCLQGTQGVAFALTSVDTLSRGLYGVKRGMKEKCTMSLLLY